jgi:hypothetical protein
MSLCRIEFGFSQAHHPEDARVGNLQMVPAEKFRHYADECRRMALATNLSQDDRAILLKIATDWLLLASPELAEAPASSSASP